MAAEHRRRANQSRNAMKLMLRAATMLSLLVGCATPPPQQQPVPGEVHLRSGYEVSVDDPEYEAEARSRVTDFGYACPRAIGVMVVGGVGQHGIMTRIRCSDGSMWIHVSQLPLRSPGENLSNLPADKTSPCRDWQPFVPGLTCE
jgi:hypothetical protein